MPPRTARAPTANISSDSGKAIHFVMVGNEAFGNSELGRLAAGYLVVMLH